MILLTKIIVASIGILKINISFVFLEYGLSLVQISVSCFVLPLIVERELWRHVASHGCNVKNVSDWTYHLQSKKWLHVRFTPH